MKKIIKSILAFFIFALFAFSFSRSASAANLTVDCPDNGPACSITPVNTPLFEEPNIYPGYSVTRQITVNNHDTNEDCSLLLRVYNLRDLHNLAIVLPTSIVSGATTYFSQTLNQLFNLPVPGTLSLGTVLAGGTKVYDWQVTMSTGAGNEYQGVSTLFDFDLQFTCGVPEGPALTIEKTNNKKGTTLKKGDVVTYTITVSNDGGATVYDVVVKDVQPTASYFDYRENSGHLTCTGEPTIALTATGSNPYYWAIGNMLADEVCTLTYEMEILNDSIAGTHHNMAVAYGQDAVEGGKTVYSGVVYDPFDIGQPGVSASYRGEVKSEQTGTVLGAATGKVGQVLGAATGSPTFWLALVLVLVTSGSLLKLYSKFKMQKSKR